MCQQPAHCIRFGLHLNSRRIFDECMLVEPNVVRVVEHHLSKKGKGPYNLQLQYIASR